MKPKLSPTQIWVLRALGEPGAVAWELTFREAFVIPALPRKVRTSTILRLESLDLLGIYAGQATITPAGREYLESISEVKEVEGGS